MASALDGITVLDITQGMAGALATMMMCDNGARVVHVETPGDEERQSRPGYSVWDRGKQSVALDLPELLRSRSGSGPGAAERFQELVGSADVLVESFAPSSEYGPLIDADALTTANPRLVHCSITAYGKRGPLKDEPPIDDLVMARMGISANLPGFRPGPVHMAHPFPSVGAALLAAVGVVSALYSREKTGRGRSVETSLMAGALLYQPRVVGEKLEPNPLQAHPAGSYPFYSVMECADGKWLQFGCVHPGFVKAAAQVLGIEYILDDPRLGDRGRPDTEEEDRRLRPIVEGVIKTKRYDEWAEMFDKADVPYARACVTEEGMRNPQVEANGMVVRMEDPVLGPMVQMGLPIELSDTPGEVKGPRPVTGAHTEEVLSGLASAKARSDPDQELCSAPLDPTLKGVRVLEITNLIAGPTGGKLLAALGADVVKLEPLQGDISRPAGRTYFFHLNADKRSVSVNTRAPEGSEMVRAIAARSDVLLANLRPGATERMGIDADFLRKSAPQLIEAHITGYGRTGPYARRAGIDPLAQAWMGLERAQGGPENPPVFHSQLAPTDFTAGAMCALGAIMALLVRERTGRSQRVDTNLLNGGIIISSEHFTEYEGKPPRRLADKGQYGLSPLHRLYQTADGWIYLAAEAPEEWPRLCATLALDGLADDARFESAEARLRSAELARELADVMRQAETEALVAKLRAAELPCAPVLPGDSEAVLSDPHLQANDMVVTRQHPTVGRLQLSANTIRFGDTLPISGRLTPFLGEHNREVLCELGYSQDRIEELYTKGVVTTEHAA